ncbi:ABC transporter permease [Sphaerisporangium corydalis]|uniref:ABC transporter permease n=1 Tax=Sphaerisporangium corydalis TaxID=1441875 RepID=A0ABV9ERV8_9ACTN|nr:ABC transporter permease [Sphaerisporangium corydalis]
MTTTTSRAGRHAAESGTEGGRRGLLGVLEQMWLIPLVLVAWELGARQGDSIYFPPPTTIVTHMYELWFSGPASHLFLTEEAVDNLPPSVGRLLAGWAIAGVIGVGLGIALGRSKALSGYIDPILEFARAIPPPALIPLFIVLFKLGTQMQLATIVYGVIWPILVNTVDGARHVDRVHADTAQVFGLGRRQRLFRIILPAAAPKIFAGLRLSLSLAVILMVVSELVGATDGLGYLILFKQQSFDLAGMWGAMVLLSILGFVLNASFLFVERRVLSWHRRAQQTT